MVGPPSDKSRVAAFVFWEAKMEDNKGYNFIPMLITIVFGIGVMIIMKVFFGF